jgi:hypothetical protein
MRGTLAIFSRELCARRDVLWLALALAVLATAMPWLPGLEGHQPDDVRVVAAGSLALLIGLLLAVAFGVGLVGRDLSEGRLGFYFARPVSGAAIWLGKLAAALVLILGCELIVLLSGMFGGLPRLGQPEDEWIPLVALTAAPLLVLVLVHGVGVMVRARTAWLALDLIAAVSFALVAWLSLRPLLDLGAGLAATVVAGCLTAALLVALLFAGGLQVAHGRTDLARSHRVLSLALWSILAVATAGAAAYGWWLRSFTAADVVGEWVWSESRDGLWSVVMGTAPGRLDVYRGFLVSADGRHELALPTSGWMWGLRVAFADDGSTAVWVGGDGRSGPLVFADLRANPLEPEATTLVVDAPRTLLLTPSGRRLAMVEEGLLTLTSLPEGRLVSSVRLPQDLERAGVFLLDDDHARLVTRLTTDDGTSVLRQADVDLDSGAIVRRPDIPGVDDEVVVYDVSMARLAVRPPHSAPETREAMVFDAMSGLPLRRLDRERDGTVLGFLSDGRLLAVRDDGESDGVLSLLDLATGDVTEVGVPLPTEGSFFREVGANAMVVATDGSWSTGFRLESLDLGTGQRRLVGAGLFPFWGGDWVFGGGDAGPVLWSRAGGRTSLLVRRDRELLRLDPQTGELIPQPQPGESPR